MRVSGADEPRQMGICGDAERSGDKGNSTAVDWKQFNAYDGEKLVAIIDLCKDSNGIHHYIAFGGLWFD